MIRDYPILKAEYERLHEQQITAAAMAIPAGGSAGRKTERIVLRELPGNQQKKYDAVHKAVQATRMKPSGADKIKLIKYVYWGREKRRIKDAALEIHISEETAKRWHGEFVKTVGHAYGYDISEN